MTTADAQGPVCEACGYSLAGLSTGHLCPECRQGVWKSISSRRYGSAWQRGGGREAWLVTVLDFLVHPRREFRKVTIERRRSRALLGLTLLVAAVLGSTPWLMIIAMSAIKPWPYPVLPPGLRTNLQSFGTVLGLIALLWLVMAVATGMVCVTMRALGRERGWRITWDVGVVVCAHAAVGWIVGALIPVLSSLIVLVMWLVMEDAAGAADLAMASLWLGGALGLAWFAALVALGVGACRFANPGEWVGT